jgi:chromate transporter
VDPVTLFVTFLRASVFSLGGQSGLPLLREDLLRSGALTDSQIIDGLVIGRLSTGPGGLYMVSLGYLAGGGLGAGLALVAIALPPLLILPAASWLRPRLANRRVNGLIRGLAFTTSGLVAATSLDLLFGPGSEAARAVWQLALAVAGMALSFQGRIHPALIVLIGAAAGLALSP